VAEERQPDRYSKGALAAVAASALVVGVAAGILLSRRRAARRHEAARPPIAVPPVIEAPEPAPVSAPPLPAHRGWRSLLRTDRTQRRLARVTAAIIIIAVALVVPIQRAQQEERVTLTIQPVQPTTSPQPLFGPDTISKVVVDPRVEPGSTVRLREAPPECRPTRIGRTAGSSVTARSAPSRYSHVVKTFPRVNQQGAVQVYDLVDHVINRRGHRWYQALLPMRPNGTKGWIRAGELRLRQTSYRIDISQRKLTLKVYRNCWLFRTFPIGLGKESTPTPVGRFYIGSLMQPTLANSVYGKWAYGLSAFSDAITDWTGGGVIGIHGTNDPSSVGQTVSHGCIRMRNEDIDTLVKLLPLGTPVRIGSP
jgi:lipoprotein-anchoring transpeptidase ErfK/SrfK